MMRFILALPVLVAACAPQPVTPEEAARQCEDRARAAQARGRARASATEQNGEPTPEQDKDD